MPAAGARLSDLLAQARAARDANDTPAGLQAAEQAWQLAATADADTRLEAGRLLLQLRYRSGALWALVDAGLEVLPLMRAARLPDAELLEALRMVVLGAADTGRFEVAMAHGQEAHALALRGGDPAQLSLAINAIGCVYERLGDPWHAEQLLLDALALARGADHTHATFVALNNLTATAIGTYYLMHDAGPEPEALDGLQRALPHAERALEMARVLPDTFYRAFVQGNLGEVLLHLGRVDEARAALDEAWAATRQGGFEAQAWRLGCTLGELHLRLGDAATAWEGLARVWAASTEADARNTHLRLHHAMWRAARALGRHDDALDHLERYQRLEHRRILSQLRARSQLFVTTVEAEQVRLEARRAGERAHRAEVSARRDPLTGLGNRRELLQRWPQLSAALVAAQRPLAVAMLDIDHFKQVNDRHGHAVGDRVLVVIGQLLHEAAGAEGLAVRLGGEELLLVLAGSDGEQARQQAEQLRQRIAAEPWDALAPGLTVDVSIGVAASPPYELGPLLSRADDALYTAKRSGRGQVQRA